MCGAVRLHVSCTIVRQLSFLSLSLSLVFLVPPSLYALSRGGVKSSATIADVFDIGGFSLLAVFNGYVAGINHSTPAAWKPTFTVTTACSAISLVAVSLAVFLEGRRNNAETTATLPSENKAS